MINFLTFHNDMKTRDTKRQMTTQQKKNDKRHN